MPSYALVSDIGGTHARFALVDVKVCSELLHVVTLPCADFTTVDDAISHYLNNQPFEDINQASLAIAAPVSDADIVMANDPWRFNKQSVRASHGFDHCLFINDFTAMALGVRVIFESSDDSLKPIGKLDDAGLSNRSHRLVIGPGAGLGVSALIYVSGHWLPLTTEGGHSSFAPTTDHELAIWTILMKKYGRVSNERLLSGSGLLNIYECHAELAGEQSRYRFPADVVAAALANAFISGESQVQPGG